MEPGIWESEDKKLTFIQNDDMNCTIKSGELAIHIFDVRKKKIDWQLLLLGLGGGIGIGFWIAIFALSL